MLSLSKHGFASFSSPFDSFRRASETAEQLYQAIEQMGRMQRILESYRNEILTKHPRTFALLAKGALEQLRQLQRQIDDYLQRVEAAAIPTSQ